MKQDSRDFQSHYMLIFYYEHQGKNHVDLDYYSNHPTLGQQCSAMLNLTTSTLEQQLKTDLHKRSQLTFLFAI